MSNSVNLALDVTKTDIQNTSIKIRQGDAEIYVPDPIIEVPASSAAEDTVSSAHTQVTTTTEV